MTNRERDPGDAAANRRRPKPTLFDLALDDEHDLEHTGLRLPDGGERPLRGSRSTPPAQRKRNASARSADRSTDGAAPRAGDPRESRPARDRSATTSAGTGSLMQQAEQRYRSGYDIDDEAERVNDLFARPYSGGGSGWGRGTDVLRPPSTPWFEGNWKLLVIALVSMVIIWWFVSSASSGTVISPWQPAQQFVSQVAETFGFQSATPNPPGDYNLRGAPSISAAQIDQILAEYNSPAVGTGEIWVRLGREYNIDPAFAVAFFIHESSAGSNPNWAGYKPDGSTTHNVGNIICAGYATCHGRFRDYPSWEDGIRDWYRLIDVEYLEGRGHQTVGDIIPVYAPAFENDVEGYVVAVHRLVDEWRIANQGVVLGADPPAGNPLGTANTVMTQGYGVGSHAPAATWGAIDLALDGNGDGRADPDGSWDQPIYATHSGQVKVTPNSWPAGNHVWVINERYRTGYAHLNAFAVEDGQIIERGTLIGYMGSTGQSSGPHLDYQVWQKQGSRWVNVNPLDFNVWE